MVWKEIYKNEYHDKTRWNIVLPKEQSHYDLTQKKNSSTEKEVLPSPKIQENRKKKRS
jgi:hypothetical protein